MIYFYLLLNDFDSNFCKRACLFYAIFSLCNFELFFWNILTSQVTFSRFRSSFLSHIYCSHSKVKLVANKKSVAALQKYVMHSAVVSAGGYGSGGHWF